MTYPALHFRPKAALDADNNQDNIQDLAYAFMEDEVGRFDWRINWPKFKSNLGSQENVVNYVQAWLDTASISCNPQSIISYLDTFCSEQVGRWL